MDGHTRGQRCHNSELPGFYRTTTSPLDGGGESEGLGVLLQRFTGFALAFAGLCCALGATSPAEARGSRHAAMIIDANTGKVLHDEEGDEQRHPASLTKMMTLYLAFEAIESGRMSMSDRVKISQEAANVAPSKLELEPGEDIAVSDAIKAIITKSANDIAVAMAEKIGGSQSNFVRLMNAKAHDLGMAKSHFENASGLPNNAQVTTARDMITLAMHLQDDFPRHYPLFAMREFRYNGATHRNHNTMLGNYAGIDGIKTGYTQSSGFNLVSSVHRGEKHLIGAVFGGASAATRNGEMRVLLNRNLTLASSTKTRKPMLIAKLKAAPKLAERPAPKQKMAPAVVVAAVEAPPVKITPAPKLAAPKPVAARAAPVIALKPTVAPQTAAAEGTVEPEEAASVREPVSETVEAPQAADPEAEARAVAASAAAPAPVEVFKVHRVMVAPRKPKPAAPAADETTDMAPEGKDTGAPPAPVEAAPRVALGEVAPEHAAEPLTIAHLVSASSRRMTVVEKKTAEHLGDVPSAQLGTQTGIQMAMLGAGDRAATAMPPAVVAETQNVAALPTPAAADKMIVSVTTTAAPLPAPIVRPAHPVTASLGAAKPAPARIVTVGLTHATAQPLQAGNKPSTLQAQAASLVPSKAAASRQQVANLATPKTPTAAPVSGAATGAAAGRFEIQIGAYASVDEAQRTIAQVQIKAGKLLQKYPSVTLPVNKAGRQIYRARFRGFEAQTAANTCAQLRTQAIDCFVMAAE